MGGIRWDGEMGGDEMDEKKRREGKAGKEGEGKRVEFLVRIYFCCFESFLF